jgi:hypothetical protein
MKYFLVYNKMEDQFVKYNYHLGDDVSEDGEDAEDEKSNSMSGST